MFSKATTLGIILIVPIVENDKCIISFTLTLDFLLF